MVSAETLLRGRIALAIRCRILIAPFLLALHPPQRISEEVTYHCHLPSLDASIWNADGT